MGRGKSPEGDLYKGVKTGGWNCSIFSVGSFFHREDSFFPYWVESKKGEKYLEPSTGGSGRPITSPQPFILSLQQFTGNITKSSVEISAGILLIQRSLKPSRFPSIH